MFTRIVDKILDSPLWKTILSGVFPIVSSIFSGTFVTEIYTTDGFAWMTFYRTKSFYFLIVLAGIIYSYNRYLYQREKEVSRFSNAEFCIAYVRSKCLPEVAEKFKLEIRNGSGENLAALMAELKKSLR